MASQPKASTSAQPKDPPPVPNPPPAAKVEGHAHPDPVPADAPVKTAADEQRDRSEAIQAQGVQAWKDEHDERDPDEKPKTVPGIQHRPVEEHEARGARR